MLATVRWETTSFMLVGSLSVTPKGKFLGWLYEVIKKPMHFDGIPPEAIYFSNSLSPKDIQAYLKDNAFEKAVFKLAVSLGFQSRYEVDLEDTAVSDIKLKQVLLPEHIAMTWKHRFFVFCHLQPPYRH